MQTKARRGCRVRAPAISTADKGAQHRRVKTAVDETRLMIGKRHVKRPARMTGHSYLYLLQQRAPSVNVE